MSSTLGKAYEFSATLYQYYEDNDLQLSKIFAHLVSLAVMISIRVAPTTLMLLCILALGSITGGRVKIANILSLSKSIDPFVYPKTLHPTCDRLVRYKCPSHRIHVPRSVHSLEEERSALSQPSC